MISMKRAMRDIYKIAGKIIELRSIYKDVHILCNNYRCSGIPDFAVTTARSDIDFERDKSAALNKKEKILSGRFTDGYLETLAVYRKIAENMLKFDTILFHGSVIAVDGSGYMFTAKSGTGKSTHTRLWREYFGKRAVMVNDDKPLLKVTEKQITAFGTPWCGKHKLNGNIAVTLKAICILNRSEKNYIQKISKSNAYPALLQQIYRPADGRQMHKTLDLLDIISDNVSLYKLGCNMNIEAAKISYNGMQ